MNSTLLPAGYPRNYTSYFTPDNALALMIVQSVFVCIGAPGNAMVAYFISRKSMKLSDIMIFILALSDGLYCVAR